ncbi:MAG: cytoplasmic protein [Nitrospiraceae bacterium]|nr:cytoplasmic protein [Nitrospiraceae bacterium]
MQKYALFVFNGEMMCFVHVLLNAIQMHERGLEARIVMEGASTRLLPELVKPDNPLAGLFAKAKEQGLVDGVCRACSQKMGTLAEAEAQGLPLLDDMQGHPGMAGYTARGYTLITF